MLTLYSPYFADHYGRKVPIIIGCFIEFIGTMIGTFSNGTGSTLTGMSVANMF